MVQQRIFKIIRPKEDAKLQLLQDSNEINGDNLNNVQCEASIHFRKGKREYPKEKINEIAMNSKKKNVKDLYTEIN
jgi:hypothetical protein